MMRWFSTLAGVWLIAIGIAAVIDDDLADHAWWFVGGAFVAAGLLGLLSATRRPETS